MNTRIAFRNLLLAVMLPCLWIVTGTCTAANQSAATGQAPANAQQAAEYLEELAEIRVSGERLADQIADSEDEFFPLYNTINRNNDFDIKCNRAYLDPGSLIMSRICLPGFLGKDYGAPPNGDGGYEPPPLRFIVMAKSGEMRRNMQKVILNDPRLLAMSDHLGSLYMALDNLQHRFRKARGIEEPGARRAPRSVKVSAGPRVLL
jgi:hypothetical protein